MHSFTWVLVRCIQCGWKLLVSCINDMYVRPFFGMRMGLSLYTLLGICIMVLFPSLWEWVLGFRILYVMFIFIYVGLAVIAGGFTWSRFDPSSKVLMRF